MSQLSQNEIDRLFRASALRSYARREATYQAERDRILGSTHRWAVLACGTAAAMVILAFLLLLTVVTR